MYIFANHRTGNQNWVKFSTASDEWPQDACQSSALCTRACSWPHVAISNVNPGLINPKRLFNWEATI